MITNTQLTEMGLAPYVPSMPVAFNRISKAGKTLGTRQTFTGHGTAADVKAAILKANPKLSNKERKARVNEVLRGSVNLAQQVGLAYFMAACQDGGIPTHGDRNKAGDKTTIVIVKPKADKVAAPVVDAVLTDKVADLTAKNAALAAELATLRAGK